MSVAKSIEITAASNEGFEAAIAAGLSRAAETTDHLQRAWVKDLYVEVDGANVAEYRVNMKVTFLIKE